MTGQTTELPRIGSPGSGLGDSWRVIVRNDDHNTFDHVARTLARYIPATSLARGHELRASSWPPALLLVRVRPAVS